jgi:glyoxylase-like metal-dependent hydrolase (beta-lactamase superfamily II)
MLRLEAHDDVTRVILSSRASRLVGFGVSAYLVRGVLVDTGFPGAAAELLAWVQSLGARLRGAVLTHKHEDHAGNVEALARRGVPLAMSDATRAAVRVPQRIGFYRRFTWRAMTPLVTTPVPLALAPLELVPTPGHSSDHHAVWDPGTRTLFGGDLFLGVKVRIAHPGEDPRRLARSLRAAAALEPRRLFDAHRGPVPAPAAALRAKADWLDETLAAVDRLLDAGWSDAAIRQAVLGREELAGWFSRGDYSRLNFVRAARQSRE